MKVDFFLLVCIIFFVFLILGVFWGIKVKKASLESSYVLPLLGLCVATAISLAFMVGFIEYVIKIYTGSGGIFSGFSEDVIRIPALFGSVGLTYLSLIGFIKFFKSRNQNGQ